MGRWGPSYSSGLQYGRSRERGAVQAGLPGQDARRDSAYARSYESSEQHAAHLNPWLHSYNWNRLHSSLGYKPPISRSPLSLNNPAALHS